MKFAENPDKMTLLGSIFGPTLFVSLISPDNVLKKKSVLKKKFLKSHLSESERRVRVCVRVRVWLCVTCQSEWINFNWLDHSALIHSALINILVDWQLVDWQLVLLAGFYRFFKNLIQWFICFVQWNTKLVPIKELHSRWELIKI